MAGLSGVQVVAESDTMSGIEPLGSVLEVSAGFSPAHDGRTVSARSSANTAELLASTLLPVSGISDTEVSPQFDAAKSMQQSTTERQTKVQDKPLWKDEDGQTVSSIFSPLSGTGTNISKEMTSSCPPQSNVHMPHKDQKSRSTFNEGQHSSSEKNTPKTLHSSLLTPQKLETFQSVKTSSRSLQFTTDTQRANAISSDIEDRRRHFVDQFNQNSQQRPVEDTVHFSQSGTKEVERQSCFEGPSRTDEEFRVFGDVVHIMAKDFEEKRLSADSTLTEQLLRGITPMEDTSPYSFPYDSGLASNILSYSTSQRPLTVGFQSESQYLQETLEKEKYRRKHCELQIKELQAKLLENQQLLAVAEATRRKKDSMIAQVEKNFSKIMSDWKSKDKEKLETLDRLKKECDKQEQISRMREQELQVQENENKTLRQLQERLQAELCQLKEESAIQIEDAEQQMKLSIQQMEQSVEDKVAAEQHVRKVQEILAKERSQWREKELNLTGRLAKMEEKYDKKQKEFMATLEKETEAAQQVLADSNASKKKLAQMKEDLSKVLQEKESLSLELNLKQAQFEASLQKQEMDWKEQLERLIQERMETLQDETSQQIQKQKEIHHQQIAEMTERQQEEMKRLRSDHATEMKMKESRYQSSIQQFQTKLDQSHQEVLKLTSKLEQVQKHRSTIIQKMQSFLQSYTSDTLMMLGQLDSSPAVSSGIHLSNVDTSSPTTQSNHPSVEITSSKTVDGSNVLQGGRLSPDQMFSQFLSTLSSDGGYQTLPSRTDVPMVPTSQVERKDRQSFHGTGNWSFMSGTHQTMSYEQDQPLPIKYTTVVPPSLPPLHATQGTHLREGMSPLVTAPKSMYHSSVAPTSKGQRTSLDNSRVSLQSRFSSERTHQHHHPIPHSDFTNAQTSKLYQYERPEVDFPVEHPSHIQQDERSHSQHVEGGHTLSITNEDQAQFVPLMESEDLSMSEHPLDNTSQTLGDLTERMGKEEERRQLLQHYLKELLHQTSWSQHHESTANPETSEEVQYPSRDPHKTRFSQRGASTVFSSLPPTQEYHRQTGTQEQLPNKSTVPVGINSSQPSSKAPVQRNVVTVKERTQVLKEVPTRLCQRSAEDSSKSGRRSANSSANQGRSSSKEPSASFGTSTPKKKGNPQPGKPPTRKTKSGKKLGVWR